MIAAVRDVVDGGRVLKVNLETGVLGQPKRMAAASRLAIGASADFLKTSGGKAAVSATPEAATAMLGAIRAAPRLVGLKVPGGLRALSDASAYLDLTDRIMGPGWATPGTFRIGASSVYDALIASIEGRAGTAAAGTY